MPGMKAVGEEDKCHANQQHKQSDESETGLLLLHVVAVFDKDEHWLVVYHAYRWISSSTSSWLGVSHCPRYHGSRKSSVSQAAMPKEWTRPAPMHSFILKVNRLLKNIQLPHRLVRKKSQELGVEHLQSQNLAIEKGHVCLITSAWVIKRGRGSNPVVITQDKSQVFFHWAGK